MGRRHDPELKARARADDARADRVTKPERKRMVSMRHRGMTIGEIAGELRRDARTVSSQLKKAAEEKQRDKLALASDVAPVVAMGRALEDHWRKLRKTVGDLKSRIDFPPATLLGVVDEHGPVIERIVIDGLPWAGFYPDVVTKQEVDLEGTDMFEQLKQHLSGHPILDHYDDWRAEARSLKEDCSELFSRICREADERIEATLDRFSAPGSGLSHQLGSIRRVESIRRQWPSFVESLRGLGWPVHLCAALKAGYSTPVSAEGNILILAFYDHSHKDILDDPGNKRLVEDKIAEFFGTRYAVFGIVLPVVVMGRRRRIGVDRHNYATSIYQYVVSQKKKEVTETKLEPQEYRVELDESTGMHKLCFGSSELACLPLEIVKALEEVYRSLVQKYKDSPEVRQIATLEQQLFDLESGLHKELESLSQRLLLPGRCKICQSYVNEE